MIKMILNKRILLLAASLIFGAFVVWGGAHLGWSSFSANLTYLILSIFFLGMMVSSQQYEEDVISIVERVVSSFLFSYLLFFRLLYAPLSDFFFRKLIDKVSFFADTLALFLFLIFFFLFGTTFLVLNTFSRQGLLNQWTFFNNSVAFFILRFFFLALVGVFVMLYARNSFFSVKYSYYINKFLPPSTCGWSYKEYPNYPIEGRSVSGENACLFKYAQDLGDAKYCELILDEDVKKECAENIFQGSGKAE